MKHKKVDLHLHTNASDGSWGVDQLLKILIENKKHHNEIEYIFEYIFHNIFGLKAKTDISYYETKVH